MPNRRRRCQISTARVYSGVAKHGALCRPVQPHQAAGAVPPVVRPNHGGVLPAGRQRAAGRVGHFTHV